MSDDPEIPEEEEEEAEDAVPALETLYFQCDAGDVVITDVPSFIEKFEALAVRSIRKTSDLEVLVANDDGTAQWKKLGRHLKVVSK